MIPPSRARCSGGKGTCLCSRALALASIRQSRATNPASLQPSAALVISGPRARCSWWQRHRPANQTGQGFHLDSKIDRIRRFSLGTKGRAESKQHVCLLEPKFSDWSQNHAEASQANPVCATEG